MIGYTAKTMLFVVAGLVSLSGLCAAEYFVRCSDHTNVTTTLRPSKDGVQGRYELEWCTEATPEDTDWAIEIGYNQRKLRSCGYRDKHSGITVNLDKKFPNCSNVCMTFTPLDLIFDACYTVHNWFPNRGSMKEISIQNITSGITMDTFSNTNFSGVVVYHENYVAVHFYTGIIPVPDFNVELSKKNSSDAEHVMWRKSVRSQCSSSLYELVCRLRVSDGHYSAAAVFAAPWTQGNHNFKKSFYISFRVERGATRAVDAARGISAALWWACGALGVVCAGALALLLALRCRRAALARKQVLRDWLHRVDSKSESKPAEARQPSGPILLLYARECASAEPVVAALCDLLDTVAPGQVYDISSPTTVALAAPGGGDWLRGLMARGDARVVLLQTPALQALYTPRCTDTGSPKLEQPLLARRCVYRAPGAGDALLALALRLLADAAHALPYRKYYLATLEGLETEALPYAVPFRRYLLPLHALTLVQDLAPLGWEEPKPQLQHRVDTLAHAAVGFLDYAKSNPDYLMDELLIL